jgi:hypothetical protein
LGLIIVIIKMMTEEEKKTILGDLYEKLQKSQQAG